MKENKASDETSASTAKAHSNMKVLVGGLVVALLVGVGGVYGVAVSQTKKLSTQPFALKSAEVFHLPAVKADNDTLLYTDYMHDLTALKKLASNPATSFGPATDQDLSDLVIANFLTRVKSKEFAQKYSVSLTSDEIAAAKKNLFDQYGEAEVAKNIQESYGWDVDTFVKKIIEPSLLNNKVRDAFKKSTAPEATQFTEPEVHVHHILIRVSNPEDKKEKAEKQKKAQGILARLRKGEDFAKLATEFTEDTASKQTGGDLGWISKGMTEASFDSVAFSLEPNKISDLVETSYGFHIVKVSEKRIVPDFDTYLETEVKKMTPKFYIPIHNPLAVPETTATSTPETK